MHTIFSTNYFIIFTTQYSYQSIYHHDPHALIGPSGEHEGVDDGCRLGVCCASQYHRQAAL